MDLPEKPTVVSLCSGYCGIELGIERAIGRPLVPLAYVERESFAVANLVAKMEAVEPVLSPAPVWTDVKTFPSEVFRGAVTIVLGGYPCQPFSIAGRKEGVNDPRHLWPHIRRIVQTIRPSFVFFENVENHVKIGLSTVLSDLAEDGYDTEWGLFSAEEAGAPQRRKRIFILGKLGDAEGDEQRGDFVPAMHGEGGSLGGPGDGVLDDGLADACGKGPEGCLQGEDETGRTVEEPPSGCRPDGSVALSDEGGRGAGERDLLQGQPDSSGGGETGGQDGSMGKPEVLGAQRVRADGEQVVYPYVQTELPLCASFGSIDLWPFPRLDPKFHPNEPTPQYWWEPNRLVGNSQNPDGRGGDEGEQEGQEVWGAGLEDDDRGGREDSPDELVDSECEGLQGAAGEKLDETEEPSGGCAAGQRDEAEPEMGGDPHGDSCWDDHAELLEAYSSLADSSDSPRMEIQMIGNGVVPAVAENAWRTLFARFADGNRRCLVKSAPEDKETLFGEV